MIAYKLVRELPDGSLVSYLIGGEDRIQYYRNKTVETKKACCFKTKEQALENIWGGLFCEATIKLFKVKIKPSFIQSKLQRKQKFNNACDWDYSTVFLGKKLRFFRGWPKGTIFADSVKLLEEIKLGD